MPDLRQTELLSSTYWVFFSSSSAIIKHFSSEINFRLSSAGFYFFPEPNSIKYFSPGSKTWSKEIPFSPGPANTFVLFNGIIFKLKCRGNVSVGLSIFE